MKALLPRIEFSIEGLSFTLVCYSLKVNGWSCRPGNGGDEAVVVPKLQTARFVLFWRHCFIAHVDMESMVSLAVPDHWLVVAIIW